MPSTFGQCIIHRLYSSVSLPGREPISRMLPGQSQNTLRVLARSPHSGVVGRRFCSPPSVNARMTWRASARSAVNVWRKHTPLAGRGVCPQCGEFSAGALDRHMMNNHLELGQLWRCAVEWCAV